MSTFEFEAVPGKPKLSRGACVELWCRVAMAELEQSGVITGRCKPDDPEDAADFTISPLGFEVFDRLEQVFKPTDFELILWCDGMPDELITLLRVFRDRRESLLTIPHN